MIGNAWSSVNVIRKEEKQPALEAMIAQDLKRRKNAAAPLEDRDYFVVARSPESPVVQALRALSEQISAAGITVYCIFSSVTHTAQGKQSETPGTAIFRSRHLSDARFLEAHEILRLGATTCWVGDCMRRDPSAYDAYEQFNVSCSQTSGQVKETFDRFWPLARPMRFVPFAASLEQAEDILEADLALAHEGEIPKDALLRVHSTTRH